MSNSAKFIRTQTLEIAFEERGDLRAKPVILAHGFPDDVRTWDGVVEKLAQIGFLTIAPYSRGCGRTRFLHRETPRSGQVAALGQDIIEFADALKLNDFILVGHDLGSDASFIAASLNPHRVRGLVLLAPDFSSGDLDKELSFEQARSYWYAWYFGTERGRAAFAKKPKSFCRRLWQLWSPNLRFDDAAFEQTAASFDNPDFVEVVMHCYRHFGSNAAGIAPYDKIDEKLAAVTSLAVPTVLLHGADDGATLRQTSLGKEDYFTNFYERRVLAGVGHFVQREKPAAVVDAVLSFFKS